MRAISALAVILSTVIPALAAEGDASRPSGHKPPVNTICPVEGKKVESAVAPIAGKTKEGKTVMIAACCDDCAGRIRAQPDAYADDAVANRRHQDAAK